MEKRFEKKMDVKRDQLKDRAQIAEGKAKLAGHQAKEKMEDWGDEIRNDARHAKNVVNEKTTQASNRAKEEVQKEKDRWNERKR